MPHPLERLRGYIRTYVSLEGLAVLVLYLALWFWIGLLLDYGLFKPFGAGLGAGSCRAGFAAGMLGILVAGLLAVVACQGGDPAVPRVPRRSALALVLERRFPQELGDRLITAVELADPHKAAELRLLEAHGRADDPRGRPSASRSCRCSEVFDWRRLGRLRLVLAGC